MLNIFSVDLEDWYCASVMKPLLNYGDWQRCSSRVRIGTEYLLDVLDRHDVEATFFVLGYIADREPGFVKEIAGMGHEIATHGYAHRNLGEMSPADFREDVQRSVQGLEDLVSQKVLGFRAPDFSVNRERVGWVSDILADQGLLYDSSVFPCGMFRGDNMGSTCSGTPFRFANGLIEIPVSCTSVAGLNIPATGGAYCRHLPLWLTRRLYSRANRSGDPVVFYTHPWEYDPDQPSMELPGVQRIRHYRGIFSMRQKLDELLSELRFTSVRKYLRREPVPQIFLMR